jgi:hypothetical protein
VSQAFRERCEHGPLLGLCVVQTCQGYDGRGASNSSRPRALRPVAEPKPPAVSRREALRLQRRARKDATRFPLRRSAMRIAGIVADAYGLSTDDILSKVRYREIVEPRMVLFWLCRHATRPQWSYPGIGRALGRDHTTVMHSVSRVERMIADDPEFAERVGSLRRAAEAIERQRLDSLVAATEGFEVQS